MSAARHQSLTTAGITRAPAVIRRTKAANLHKQPHLYSACAGREPMQQHVPFNLQTSIINCGQAMLGARCPLDATTSLLFLV